MGRCLRKRTPGRRVLCRNRFHGTRSCALIHWRNWEVVMREWIKQVGWWNFSWFRLGNENYEWNLHGRQRRTFDGIMKTRWYSVSMGSRTRSVAQKNLLITARSWHQQHVGRCVRETGCRTKRELSTSRYDFSFLGQGALDGLSLATTFWSNVLADNNDNNSLEMYRHHYSSPSSSQLNWPRLRKRD